MKKKTITKEEAQIVRVSRYFRKILKLIAKELLAKKYVDKNTFYGIVERFDVQVEAISVSLIAIELKQTEKYFPKVKIKCHFQNLKESMKPFVLLGKFSLRKPLYKHKEDNYFVNDYKIIMKAND